MLDWMFFQVKVNAMYWKEMENKLTAEAESFLQEAYGMKLKIPVVVNGRLKSTHGRFLHRRNRKESVRIEIGKNYIENHPWEVVERTLIHECIHYALYELGQPYRDGDLYFEKELRKHGSHSTNTIPYKGKVEQYRCPTCGIVINRKKKYPNMAKGYTHRGCGVQIEYMGQKIM